jgi:hypothetical protein
LFASPASIRYGAPSTKNACRPSRDSIRGIGVSAQAEQHAAMSTIVAAHRRAPYREWVVVMG